jgi:tRNA(Ile)-lysidine synthetase-like protein
VLKKAHQTYNLTYLFHLRRPLTGNITGLPMPIEDAIAKLWTQAMKTRRDERIVVGVSGGADSLALLHALRGLRDRLNLRLHAATFDHGLRGEQGAKDAQYVAEMAKIWDIPCTVSTGDVKAQAAAWGMGTEAAARRARYDFLASVARTVGAHYVAVAHHTDDQAETVLLHLLRGAGVQGIGGMAVTAPLPGHPDLTLVRPLLETHRAEIEAYCAKHGLRPCEDATNSDQTFLRNRLRHDVLPMLRTVNPHVDRGLIQFADIMRGERDYIEKQLQVAIEGHLHRSSGRIVLPKTVFAGLHPALQRRYIIWASGQVGRVLENLGYKHVIAALEVAQRGAQGARALLTEGVHLRIDYETLVIETDDAPPDDDLPLLDGEASVPVRVPGVTVLNGGWILRTATVPPHQGALTARVSIPEGSAIALRPRQTGDRFKPYGLNGHTQKVSKWMIDRKVPARLRDRVPLLIVNGSVAAIFWTPIATVDEGFAVDERSERVVYFWFRNNSTP